MNWSNRWLIPASLFIALTISVIPLPTWLSDFRPDWVVMTILWWNLHYPKQFNVGSSWVAGILMDAVNSTVLGQYALATTLSSYLGIRINPQFQLFSLLQKTLSILLLLAIYRMLLFWIFSVSGETVETSSHWKPLLTDALIWPWLSALFREIVRHFTKAEPEES